MMPERRCPACGEGPLSPQIGTQSVEYKGTEYELPVYYSTCAACGSDIATPEQSLANKRAIQGIREGLWEASSRSRGIEG